jgi:TPP-dependent 2-oxoacid decarboxylase
MRKTVIEHVLSRPLEIGIRDVFGVAGDFAFPINDAVTDSKGMRWIGRCNELNAAYSADGNARVHGMAALCTKYGVGELSAINGVAGSYAEYLPIFHLVGISASRVQAGRLKIEPSCHPRSFSGCRRQFPRCGSWSLVQNRRRSWICPSHLQPQTSGKPARAHKS